MQIRSNRLVIRDLKDSDLKSFIELHTSKKVMQMIPMKTLSQEESIFEFKRIIKNKKDSKVRVYAIEEISIETMIGTFAIIDLDDNSCEIGYRIIPKYWGKEYASEAVKVVLNHLKKNFHYIKVKAIIDIKNTRSQKVIEKFLKLDRKQFSENNKAWEFIYSLEL